MTVWHLIAMFPDGSQLAGGYQSMPAAASEADRLILDGAVEITIRKENNPA